MPTDVRYRTKAGCVEMALIRQDATEEERSLRPPVPLDDADVSLRFHRTLLTTAMKDPQLIQTLTPLLKKLWEAQVHSTGDTTGSKLERETKWDIDLDWVSLDIKLD